jgi:subtilisin family serine protease
MRKPGVKSIAAAVLTAAIAAPGVAHATPACTPIATSYESGAPTSAAPNDPLLSRQWGLTTIKASGAWNRGALGGGATIAIVDTGVDLNHPDLKDKLLDGVDLVSGETCTPGAQDLNGHGTHVAGIAAAAANNGIGVAGTAPDAKILPVRVLDPAGSGSGPDIVAGIKWAADHGAQVINLSIGEGLSISGTGLSVSSPVDIDSIGEGVDYAWQKGAVVVAAAGNSTFPLCEYPAASAHAICVASVDSTGFPSSFSNFPGRLTGAAVRAPGGDGSGSCDPDADVWSTYWPGATGDDAERCAPKGYEPLAGTSMATPFVSGIAAMLRAAGLSNQQVVDCLERTSSNGGRYDPIWGYGIVSAEAAVAGCTQLPVTGNPFVTSKNDADPTLPPSDQQPSQDPTSQGGVLGENTSSDTQPPHIRMTIPRKKAAHVARAGFITVRVRVSENSRLWLQVRNGRETQAVSRSAVVLAEALTSIKAGKTHELHIKLTKAGKRVLRVRRSLAVTLFAYAQDAAKNNGTAIAQSHITR